MLAPEFILGKALGDLSAARYYRDLMQEFAKDDEVEWSLAHSFYANMGGFMGIEDEPQDNTEGKLNGKETVPLLASTSYCLRTATDSQRDGNKKAPRYQDSRTS